MGGLNTHPLLTITLAALLTAAGDFLQRAGVDSPRPLAADDLTRTTIRTNSDYASTRVDGRYAIFYWKGQVRTFIDRDEDFLQILSRDEPGEMARLANTPAVIDEEQALQTACEAFRRIGHRDQDYDPPVVFHFTYQPDEFDPAKVVHLPFFQVKWNLKDFPRTGNLVFDPTIETVVSGRTGHLIYYSSATMTTHPDPPMAPEPTFSIDTSRR